MSKKAALFDLSRDGPAAMVPNSYAVSGPLSYHKGCAQAYGAALRNVNVVQPVPETGSGMGGKQIYYMGFGPQVIKRRGVAMA